jgi:hypothetical protein
MIPFVISFIGLLVAQSIHPVWWWVLVVPALAGLFAKRGLLAFFGVGTGAALAWMLASSVALLGDGEIVAGRVAEMLTVGNPWILVAVTGVVAFLCGSFAGLSGYFLTRMGKANELRR